MCESSVDSAFRNFFRAGVLKNKSRIVIDVPVGTPASSTLKILPPLISITVPEASSGDRVSRRRRETDAIEGNASPRHPGVERVLQKFLHYRCGAFDNFADGNLVGNGFGEDVDAAHGL